MFGLPDGEDLRVSLVTGQPWSGLQLVRRRPPLADRRQHRPPGPRARPDRPRSPTRRTRATTSSTPGRRPSWSIAQGRLESSILLINTPECLHQRGPGRPRRPVRRAARRSGSTCSSRSSSGPGLPIAADPAATREAAELAVALDEPRATRSASIRGNAALLRHADGRSHDEVVGYLRDVGRYPPDGAEKRLEFIEHPLWRTYVFVYAEGEALLRRWLDAVPEAERAARFGRLLHEQLTPAAVTVSRLKTTRSSPSAS